MKKILILSANPINTNKLRLDEEIREIRAALERAQNREVFELITREAVRIDDLRRALLDNKPSIVHFSGHGTGTDGLVLEDISGESQTVSTGALSNLFEFFKEQIECILLNACYSENQAEAIFQHVDCVIGMVQPIQDRAAINFSKGFYDAIFSGRNYADAFRFGCNNIDLNNIPESDTPTIKIRHKDSSSQQLVTNNTFKLVIGISVLGFSVGLVGLIKLAFGNAGLITNILLAFGSVILWVCCAYIYYPSSRIFGFSVTPRLLPKQYKRLRRLALAGMIIIPLLSATGFYVLQLSTEDIIVLVADFKGQEPEKYRVTRNIFDKLEDTRVKYSDANVKIQLLNQVVTEQKNALTEGNKRRATIVIWGDYGVTDTNVQLSAHFEVLLPPKYLPKIERLKYTVPVSELKSFKLQTNLSNQMVYLSLFTIGLTRYTASDWDKAIIYFSDAVNQVKNPIKVFDEGIIYFYRGISFYNQAYTYFNQKNDYNYRKNYKNAIADFKYTLKLKPKFAPAYNYLGMIYFEQKEYKSAIANLSQGVKFDPSAHSYINLGAAYLNNKDYNNAIDNFSQALKHDPSSAIAYNALGASYLSKQNCDSAIINFSQALKLNSASNFYSDRGLADLYNNRGLAYTCKKEYDSAIADYNQALKLDPSNTKAYFHRGTAYIYKKQYDRAIADYNQAIKLNPSNTEAYTNRGAAYYNKKQYDRAIADFNQALKLNPSDTQAYTNRGAAYIDKKQYDRAIADFNQALKLDPNYTNAYNGLVQAYYKQGLAYYHKKDYDRAIDNFNNALKYDPKAAYVYYYRGLIYNNKNDYDRSIDDLNQAIKLDPKNANLYYIRGINYNNKKDYDRAIADLNQAIKLDPKNANAYYFRGVIYNNKKDYNRAIADLNQAIKLDPKNANAYYFRGISYKDQDRKDKAQEDFEKVLELSENVELSQKTSQELQELGTK